MNIFDRMGFVLVAPISQKCSNCDETARPGGGTATLVFGRPCGNGLPHNRAQRPAAGHNFGERVLIQFEGAENVR